MTSQIQNVTALLTNAQGGGRISQQSAQILKAGPIFAGLTQTFGLAGADHDTTEVTGMSMGIDDSTSILHRSNSQNVRDAVNYFLDETARAQNSDEFILSMTQFNGPPICEFVPLSNAPRLDTHNYNPSGWTPLYEKAAEGLGSLIVRREEAIRNGQNFRGIQALITDGKDEGSAAGALDNFRQLYHDVVNKERSPIIVIFIGISDGRTDFRKIGQEMGLPDANIFEAKSGGHELRQIMGVVSRISQNVSKIDPKALQGLNLGAFGGNI